MKNKKEQLTEAIKQIVKKVVAEAKDPKAKFKMKPKKKATLEGLSVESCGHVDRDEVGRFYVVTNPSKDSTDENIVFETDVFNLSEKIANGSLTRENIRGIIRKGDKAKRIGERYLKERSDAVLEAKRKADDLKSRFEGIKNELGELKKTKTETKQAIAKINEAPKAKKK